jgi:hypothetical protein
MFKFLLLEFVFPFLVELFKFTSIIMWGLSVRVIVVAGFLLIIIVITSSWFIRWAVLDRCHFTIAAALGLLKVLKICVDLALDLAVTSLGGVCTSDYLLLLAGEVRLRIVKEYIDICKNLLS